MFPRFALVLALAGTTLSLACTLSARDLGSIMQNATPVIGSSLDSPAAQGADLQVTLQGDAQVDRKIDTKDEIASESQTRVAPSTDVLELRARSTLSDRRTQERLRRAFRRVRAACPIVEAKGAMGGGTFSAVIVSPDGLLLTAGHCVMPKERYIVRLPDGRRFAAKPLGRENIVDCGMIRITDEVSDLPWVKLGSSEALTKGSGVFSVGYPGEEQDDRGPVLRFGRVGDPRTVRGFIESGALMEPGDSGGPLFDLEGRLVGIHSQIGSQFDENHDVPIEVFLAYWKELESGERFRAWERALDAIGLETLDTEAGIRIRALHHDGPGHQAGLRLGDVILRVGKHEIRGEKSLRRRLRSAWRRNIWSDLTVQVERRGEKIDIALRSPLRLRLEASQPARRILSDSSSSTTASLSSRSVFRVKSEFAGKSRSILATAIDGQGKLITKSSVVGDEVRVASSDGREFVADVVFRDPVHDLCLLRVPKLTPKSWCQFSDQGVRDLGSFVRSYLPGDDEPRRGIVSTRVHRVSDRYLLGIRLRVEGNQVFVRRLDRKMPAGESGIEEGDRIVSIDGRAIEKSGQIGSYLQTLEKRRPVQIEILRDGKSLNYSVTPSLDRSGGDMGFHVANRIDGGFSQRRSDFPLAFGHDSILRADECGAPLFDTAGRVLGLSIARRSRTQSLALPNVVVRGFIRRATAAANREP